MPTSLHPLSRHRLLTTTFSINIITLQACQLCQKHFDDSMDVPTIHYEGTSVVFCSKPCQNVFIMQKRKIVPCVYCKVGDQLCIGHNSKC